jgi:hypothetical protein
MDWRLCCHTVYYSNTLCVTFRTPYHYHVDASLRFDVSTFCLIQYVIYGVNHVGVLTAKSSAAGQLGGEMLLSDASRSKLMGSKCGDGAKPHVQRAF